MSIKNRLLAALAVLVITFGLDALVYGNFMNELFNSSCNKEMPDFVWLVAGLVLFSYMFCFIYSKIEWSGTRTQSGIRFAIWVTLFMAVPMNLIWHSTTNCLTMKQVVLDLVYRLVATIIIGIVAAHILKHPLKQPDIQPSGPVVKTDPDLIG